MSVLRTMLVQAFLCAACGLAAPAKAQNVVPVAMSGQPLQYMTEGSVDGCGLRIMASRQGELGMLELVEMSVNIYARGAALVKAVAYLPGTPEQLKRGLQSVKVTSAWMRAEGQKATRPLTEKMMGEDKKSLLFSTDFTSALNVLKAQLEGTRVQLYVRREGEPSDWILSGVVKLNDAESEQLLGCMQELLDSVKGLSEDEPTKERAS